MKPQMISKILSMACLVGALSLLGTACGDDNSKSGCPDGQKSAVVNGEDACYDLCDAGACDAAGFTCNSGVCIPASGGNNGTTNNNDNNNNGTNNNGTNNNGTNNNGTNNNGTSNNGTNNNGNPACTPSGIGGACDPVCQTGCAGNQACVITGTAQAPMGTCQPAGTAVENATCSANVACLAGLLCVPESQTAVEGTCQKLCAPSGTGPTCATEQTCAAANQEMTIGFCTVPEDTCVEFPDNCAEATENCYPTQIGLQCLAFDASATPGQACSTANGCNDGYRCLGANGGASTCTQLCDKANPVCALTGAQCVTVNGPDGVLPHGACVVPP